MWGDRNQIEVWRGGAKGRVTRSQDEDRTAKRQNVEQTAIVSGLPVDDEPFYGDGVTVQFTLQGPERGSLYNVWIGSFGFNRLATAMLDACPEAAETAFLSAMLKRRQKNAKSP
jgi:hypothetical protein